MPDGARILNFPSRWNAGPPLSPGAAKESARLFFESSDRSESNTELHLGNPDILTSFVEILRAELNSNPARVAAAASFAYEWIQHKSGPYLFDEHDYFLGELALLATAGERLLGHRGQSERWLVRAEAAFRHTVNPAPMLARASFEGLALRYDKRAYDEVLELVPSTLRSFEKLGMRTEAAKARFLEAMALKDCARDQEALQKFESLRESIAQDSEPGLLGQVLVEIGAFYSASGRNDEATAAYRRALGLLVSAKRMFAVAHLRVTLGETLRSQGQLAGAIESLRQGVETYESLGMVTWVAYSRLLLSDALLAAGYSRQAEWEILAALPTIEEQKMVPEGFAAVALLRESVRQRRADPNALRELREHLHAQN